MLQFQSFCVFRFRGSNGRGDFPRVLRSQVVWGSRGVMNNFIMHGLVIYERHYVLSCSVHIKS